MEHSPPYGIIRFNPRVQFGTPLAAANEAGIAEIDLDKFRYFDTALLALIVDHVGMPLRWPNLFLADLALRSRSESGDTVRTYAEALVPWLTFLFERGLNLGEVNEETLGIYKVSLINGKRDKRGRLSGGTANLRVSVACSFHTWGERKDLFPSPLGKYLLEDDRSNSPQPWRGWMRRKSKVLMPRIIKRIPRILSYEEIQRLCLITPQPYRLMLRWSVTTGMRRFEVCGLKLCTIPTPEKVGFNQSGLLQLDIVRKGAREQSIQVPVGLIEETNWYILTERSKPKMSYEEALFLNKRGVAVSRKSFTNVFRKSADSIGSDATLHHLRHTFAVHVLTILENTGNRDERLNSLKTLQVLLGHANSVTTEIYLEGMEVSAPSVVEALNYLYGASI